MSFDLDVVAGVYGETGYVSGGAGRGYFRPVVGVGYAVAQGVSGNGRLAG